MKKWFTYGLMVFPHIGGFILAGCLPAIAQSTTLVIQGQPVQQTPVTANTVMDVIQVPIVSISQMQRPNSKSGAVVYNAIYEYEGHQYSVQLPQNPGAYLTLQILAPTQMLPEPVVSTRLATPPIRVATQPIYVKSIGPNTYLTYPNSRQVRVIYPSAPYFPGGQHRGHFVRPTHSGRH